jgi:threonine/homoserine/homoserine lactone efflux protein
MPIATWLAFAFVLLVALVVPGPDFVVVVQAATRGLRCGVLTAAGIVAGLCLHAALAIAGLAVLLASIPNVLVLLRLAGAAVLLWLGVIMVRSWRTAPRHESARSAVSGGFVRGFLTNAFNPKALVFFAAILPQFIGTGPDAGTRTILLAVTVVLGSVLWWSGTVAVILAAGLGRSPKADRVVTLAGGLILTAIALGLAVTALVDVADEDRWAGGLAVLAVTDERPALPRGPLGDL